MSDEAQLTTAEFLEQLGYAGVNMAITAGDTRMSYDNWYEANVDSISEHDPSEGFDRWQSLDPFDFDDDNYEWSEEE